LTLWYWLLVLLLLDVAAISLTGYMITVCQRLLHRDFNRHAAVWQRVDSVPYAVFINSAAAKYEVSPMVVAAVIQAESSFQPRALSPAGAYGLMQVIPGTWRYVNNKIRACTNCYPGDCTPECFFKPELNIQIGTAYLSELWQRYSGNLVLAIAAYNAGPHAVDKYGTIPPFAETMEYVERVINNWYELQQRHLPMPGRAVYGLKILYRGLRYVGWGTWVLRLGLMYRNYKFYRSWRWR